MKPVPASTALEIVAVIAGLVAAVLAAVTAAAGTAVVPPIVAMVDRYACLPVSHVVTELGRVAPFTKRMVAFSDAAYCDAARPSGKLLPSTRIAFTRRLVSTAAIVSARAVAVA